MAAKVPLLMFATGRQIGRAAQAKAFAHLLAIQAFTLRHAVLHYLAARFYRALLGVPGEFLNEPVLSATPKGDASRVGRSFQSTNNALR